MEQSPKTIGPYRILGILGSGGMGVVHRGEHGETGEPVAVKTVRVARAAVVQGIRREIQALARLRHPGIVRVRAHGLENGLPWYAMELIEAPTLRQVAAGLGVRSALGATTRPPAAPGAAPPSGWTHSSTQDGMETEELEGSRTSVEQEGPGQAAGQLQSDSGTPPLQRLLTLVRRLCAPLAFLHGEGIVHGDLKPDNIFILPEGRPVLVDFGLTSRFAAGGGGEALDLGRAPAGTAAYMAPEQIAGELLDARADLYALGCILYELVTGRRPFVARSGKAVLRKQLEAAAHPPSELVAGVPPLLDELVFRLLAKRPQQRLGYAEDVAAVLGRLGADDAADPGPRPRPYLYRPSFIGRAGIVAELRKCLEQARSAETPGGVLLLGGESGAGKTRLVLEAAREAERAGTRVLSGEFSPPGAPEAAGLAGAALGALRRPLRAIADRCHEHGWIETERLLGPRGKLLALYEPALAGLPGQDSHPEPMPLPASEARARLFEHLTATFAALAAGSGQAAETGQAGSKPALTILVLDDLQWADELTIGWLESLVSAGARALQAAPLQVVGTYRSEDDGAGLASPLRRLLEDPRVRRLELGRLEEADLAHMIQEMLALRVVPEGFVRFLARHSEGNPFFVLEYLRMAVTEGLLSRDASGAWTLDGTTERSARGRGLSRFEELPLPGSIRDIVARRLDRLSPRGQELAEAAAVLARAVPAASLAAVAGMQAEEASESLVELLAAEILEEEGSDLRFAHDKIREVAYGRVEPVLRREMHRRAAGLAGAEEDLEALGRHWEEAGERERARGSYLQGARAALHRSSLYEAERLFRAYLALVEAPSTESITARGELSKDVLWAQGRNEEVILENGRMLEDSVAIGDRQLQARSLLGQGRGFWATSQLDRATGVWGQALEIAHEIGDRHVQALCLGNLASIHEEQGRFEEACGLFERALALARELGDRRFEGVCLGNLANLHSDQGHTEQALALYEQDLAIARELGDRRGVGHGLGNLASLYRDLGRLEESSALLEQAIALLRELGYLRLEGIFLADRAVLQMEQGLLVEARETFAEAVTLLEEVQDRRFEGVARTGQASLERRAGRLETAEALLQQGRELLESAGDSIHLALSLCERGHLALARGLSARQALVEARREAARMGVGPQSELGRAVAALDRAVQAAEG